MFFTAKCCFATQFNIHFDLGVSLMVHLDFIYFSPPDPDEDAEPKYEGWIWADEQMIKTGHINAFGRDEPIASDVSELSLSAIATYRKLKGINQ